MPNSDPGAPITWHLREIMAAAGMFQTTDLIEPLRRAGIQLSREQVFRLVTKPPARLNMEVLAALCTVLECTPNDLIEIHPHATERGIKAAGERRERGPSAGPLRPVRARIHRPSDA